MGGEPALGDVDAGGRPDLAVAAPNEDIGGVEDTGAVAVHPPTVGMPTTGDPGHGAEFAG